jgi:hypothetical protein
VHAHTEDESHETKDSSYKEIECVFDHFHVCHMNILSRGFSAKVGKENVLKLNVGNEIYVKLVIIL